MPELSGWFEWLVGLLVLIISWCLKQLYTEHRALETRVNQMQVDSVTKAELQAIRAEIREEMKDGFGRIERMLDKVKGSD